MIWLDLLEVLFDLLQLAEWRPGRSRRSAPTQRRVLAPPEPPRELTRRRS